VGDGPFSKLRPEAFTTITPRPFQEYQLTGTLKKWRSHCRIKRKGAKRVASEEDFS